MKASQKEHRKKCQNELKGTELSRYRSPFRVSYSLYLHPKRESEQEDRPLFLNTKLNE
jgi:hypothetical protein